MTSPLLRAALLLSFATGAAAQVEVDPELPRYTPVEGPAGNLKSVGSDTMSTLMTYWVEGFQAIHPSVRPAIEGKGSSTAPPALIAGTATFGPMSREMKKDEIDAFQKKHGYAPTGLATGIDMLAVYVHKDNPLESLTLQQVDAIFSKGRKGGHPTDVRTWGDLGLTGEWARKPISLYGRNSASGTYGYFQEHALFQGDFKSEVKEQPGSSAVVQGVATDRFGIGYSGAGFETSDVRAVPLAFDAASPPIPATAEHAYSGEYPLSRFLLVYVNHRPNTALDPLRREFLRYVFSKEGQLDVVKAGYYPLTAEMAARSLASVGIEVELAEAGFQKR